jgi:hypothetical protein
MEKDTDMELRYFVEEAIELLATPWQGRKTLAKYVPQK